jgi:hypothetical protein
MRHQFLTCSPYRFIAITRQLRDFVVELDEPDAARLAAAAQNVADAYADNRSPAGRTQLIRGSKVRGLFELRGTLAGSSGPQLRLLAVREGEEVLCARGFWKCQAKIPRREIEAAEAAIRAYRRGRHEPPRPRGRP